ncbi:MAG TPA: fused MFS/spermidine synthase, partial [Fimbriiglobus sp.]|nr:fused MFS/spermidine synthase [Fimbriiglobus sp.]
MSAPPIVPVGIVPRTGTARLAGVGAVVFLANAGLLVLQLTAGRLLAPFVGSSLETWTAIIGAFLAGIALGNAAGGRLADRRPNSRWLAVVVALGGLAALWTVALPALLDATNLHRLLPLSLRIPVLAAVLCFPPAFVLSLLTPLAIRLGLPDVRHAGRVAG